MSLDSFNSLIKDLEHTMGLSSLEQEPGYCCIEVNNDLILNFQYRTETDSLYIFCEVGSIPRKNVGTHCQELLAANLTGAHLGCGMFALEQESMTVILTLEVPLSAAKADKLSKRIDCMGLHAERCRTMLFVDNSPGTGFCLAAGEE